MSASHEHETPNPRRCEPHDIIAFPERGNDAPRPLLEFRKPFVIDGRPIQGVGQRWRAEDAAHAGVPTDPDRSNPSIVLAFFLVDPLTGTIIFPASCEEYRRALDQARANPRTWSQGGCYLSGHQ